jgi:hypothetical protein
MAFMRQDGVRQPPDDILAQIRCIIRLGARIFSGLAGIQS